MKTEQNTQLNSSRILTTRKRRLEGTIVSTKMQKTAVVEVSRLVQHKKYKKYYAVSKRFKAHNEDDQYKLGDVVVIEETRPLSREKRWKIVSNTKS